jgi:hypothetical protein
LKSFFAASLPEPAGDRCRRIKEIRGKINREVVIALRQRMYAAQA